MENEPDGIDLARFPCVPKPMRCARDGLNDGNSFVPIRHPTCVWRYGRSLCRLLPGCGHCVFLQDPEHSVVHSTVGIQNGSHHKKTWQPLMTVAMSSSPILTQEGKKRQLCIYYSSPSISFIQWWKNAPLDKGHCLRCAPADTGRL